MKIGLPANGLDNVLKVIMNELESALESKSKREKDQCICLAMGAARAAYKLTLVTDEEDENQSEIMVD